MTNKWNIFLRFVVIGSAIIMFITDTPQTTKIWAVTACIWMWSATKEH